MKMMSCVKSFIVFLFIVAYTYEVVSDNLLSHLLLDEGIIVSILKVKNPMFDFLFYINIINTLALI